MRAGWLPSKWLPGAVGYLLPWARQRLTRTQRTPQGHGRLAVPCRGQGGGLLEGIRVAMAMAARYGQCFSDFHWWARENYVALGTPDEAVWAIVVQLRAWYFLGRNSDAGEKALASVSSHILDPRAPGGTMLPKTKDAFGSTRLLAARPGRAPSLWPAPCSPGAGLMPVLAVPSEVHEFDRGGLLDN